MLTEEHFLWSNYELIYLMHFGLVECRLPKPNPMFSPLQNYTTLFVRPPDTTSKWECPVCGRKRGQRWFWTQRLPFAASAGDNGFAFSFSELLPAWTPVCEDHVLQTWPEIHPPA